MAKLSIVVPFFNVEKYLIECLTSLVNQTLKDIEIICVNDGSTDSSLQIAEEFVDEFLDVFQKEFKEHFDNGELSSYFYRVIGKYKFFMLLNNKEMFKLYVRKFKGKSFLIKMKLLLKHFFNQI